jgi:ABC-type lipoprotein export system ATPase subunit
MSNPTTSTQNQTDADAGSNTRASGPMLTISDLHKHYRLGGEDLHVLRGVDLTIYTGQWLSILGRSGSGKSTLLHLLGGLDRPDQGEVRFHERNIFRLRGRRLDYYRNRHVGFVFQFYHLLPELSALENVVISAMISRPVLTWPAQRQAVRQRARALLDRVGLGKRLTHKPSKLSGGERQRVAIARALINEPDVLLADEPTGNLDDETSADILKLFETLHAEGQTLVLVTHDNNVASAADDTLLLDHGRLTRPD